MIHWFRRTRVTIYDKEPFLREIGGSHRYSVFRGMVISSSAAKVSCQNEQITVKDVERMKDTSVQIVYRTITESMWYCPSAEIKKIAEGLELTFIRVKYNKKQKVEHLRKILREGTKVWNVVTIPSNGEAFFIRNVKDLVKLLREEGN